MTLEFIQKDDFYKDSFRKMTLEQKNEMTLYKMTIENRLKTIEQCTDLNVAIDDLRSIKAKTDYMLTSFTGWGVHKKL